MKANKMEIDNENHLLISFVKKFEKVFIRHPSFLVLATWLSILSLSTVPEFVSVPETYFSSKNNIFNQVFVKWAWAWTMLVTGSYMIVASYVYGVDSWKKIVIFACVRLFVGTCFWYFWVNIVFRFVENVTGVCFDESNNPSFNITNKHDCKFLRNGSMWLGFDISGHCFLLTYSLLLINSEIQVQRYWHVLTSIAFTVFPLGSKSMSVFKRRHHSTYSLVNVLFIFNCCLMLIWVLMLVATCLYFHTFFSKALGASCGVTSWMVTYNEWYKRKVSPGLPGSGPFHKIFLRKTKKYD